MVEAVVAIYSYEARRDDELTFKKGDVITNVRTIPGTINLRFYAFRPTHMYTAFRAKFLVFPCYYDQAVGGKVI